jgi:hypothetical protein
MLLHHLVQAPRRAKRTWYIVVYLSLNMSALHGASGCKYTLLVVSLGKMKAQF